MSKVTKRKVKQINSKSDVNKVNIFPTLAIILALIVSSNFILFNTILLFIELLLFWKKKIKLYML